MAIPLVSTETLQTMIKRLTFLWANEIGRLATKKQKALTTLQSRYLSSTDDGLLTKWHPIILQQKLIQLEEAATVEEVSELLLTAKRDNHFVKFPIHSRYWLPEEEVVYWSKLSLEAPLAEEGMDRYFTVFNKVCQKYGLENPLYPNKKRKVTHA
jgi:hypothetical protein